MSCGCGKKRAQLLQTTQASRVLEAGDQTSLQHQPERDTPIYFQYIGKTGLTVVGPRTRKRYRFDGPGVVVTVDPRDQRALAAVSILRQVRESTNVAKEF
jgi:hypothetical protein